MRKIVLVFCVISFVTHAQMDLNWSFLHPLKKEWIGLGEKGTIQEALIQTGELPDPFIGTNEGKFGWIEEHEWEFRSLFFLSDTQLTSDFVELIFPSIDTYAKVYLNDSLILKTDNAFVPHSVQIGHIANNGLNELTVVFTPPVIFHKNKLEDVGYQLPAPNDVHEVAIAPYTRKPQYQFGWDWALRMNTIGFNKPVNVVAYDNARVVSRTTRVLSIANNKAEVEFVVTLSNKQVKEISWQSDMFGYKIIPLENGVFTRKELIDAPVLWWPRGHGDQYLYKDIHEIKTVDNQLINVCHVKFGLKTSELVQEKDEWGTSYYFKINGRTIFCKGADYIPQDIFPARVSDSSIVEMVKQMKDANFNMIRVWGGGYYPDEVFFDECDKLGIMVWEDLMFACAMYPGDKEFICNVKKELNYQIPRISSHPSVVLFNGNNEVEVAWGNWGFQIKHGLYGKSAREIEKAYDLIFKEVSPAIVKEWNTIPYIHTSPLSNWGKDDFYNHGSQHYWGVWHGKDPMEDFGKKIGRFNAEYGFQSFPEYSTLNSFSDQSSWDLNSEVMKHHQKSYVGNEMILRHAERLYGKPQSFEEFVYFSQLTQAKAVSMAVAGHRLDAPRCGGTLYWQLNDCWPAPTWSSIDYYGNWKALHYQMKKDYQDVTIVAKHNSLTDKDYYLTSDLPDSFLCNVKLDVFELSGELIHASESEFKVIGNSSFLLNKSDALMNQNCVLKFTFNDSNGVLHTRMFENVVSSYSKALEDEVSFSLVEINEVDNYGVIEISTDKFLQKLWISSNIQGVHFNENFESMLPGKKLIQFSYDTKPDETDFILKWL